MGLLGVTTTTFNNPPNSPAASRTSSLISTTTTINMHTYHNTVNTLVHPADDLINDNQLYYDNDNINNNTDDVDDASSNDEHEQGQSEEDHREQEEDVLMMTSRLDNDTISNEDGDEPDVANDLEVIRSISSISGRQKSSSRRMRRNSRAAFHPYLSGKQKDCGKMSMIKSMMNNKRMSHDDDDGYRLCAGVLRQKLEQIQRVQIVNEMVDKLILS